jgi:hypothetical protein
MSQAFSSRKSSRPLSLNLRIDQACDRFELAWQAGERPRIGDYLVDTPEPERSALLRELVALDIDYRRQKGEQPKAEDYQALLPPAQLASLLDAATVVKEDLSPAHSVLATDPAAPAATPVAGPARLRCPHCHNPIQLSDARPDEVLCPACGGSFRVREAQQTTTAGGMFAIQANRQAQEILGEKKRAEDNAAEARANAAEARANLYIAQMKLPQRAWEDGNVAYVLELLEAQRPKHVGERDLRGWEWYYQDRLCHDDLRTFRGTPIRS